MVVDPLADYWKSKCHTSIFNLNKEIKANQILQIEQQGTGVAESKFAQQVLRYKLQLHIKHEIAITKRYKKRRLHNASSKINIIGKWLICMYIHIHYNCLAFLYFMFNEWINKNVAQKQNKHNIVHKFLKPYLNLGRIILEHRMFLLEFDFFTPSNDSIKEKVNQTPVKSPKKMKKTITTKRKLGEIACKEIKIISINIAGKLEEKVEQIKKLLKTEDPDLLCLQETHTYIETFKFIQGWFKNDIYDLIYCSESQKQKYEEIKKKEIKNKQYT